MAWNTPATWATDQIVTAAELNTQVRDNFNALSVHAHSGAAGDGSNSLGTVSLGNLNSITFADQSADPSVTGVMQRNGVDVKYYNGTSAINLTLADQAAGTPSLRSLGTSSTTAAAGNHSHSITISGTPSVGNSSQLTGGAMGSGNTSELDMYNQSYTATSNNSVVTMVVGTFVGNNQYGGSSYETVDVTVRLYYDGALQMTQTGVSTGAIWPTGYGENISLQKSVIGSTGSPVIRVTSQVEGSGWTTQYGFIRARMNIIENTIAVGTT